MAVVLVDEIADEIVDTIVNIIDDNSIGGPSMPAHKLKE
jgi:hypothetical protein